MTAALKISRVYIGSVAIRSDWRIEGRCDSRSVLNARDALRVSEDC